MPARVDEGSSLRKGFDTRLSDRIVPDVLRIADATDLAAFGLQVETLGFDGSFLSLAVDLPKAALEVRAVEAWRQETAPVAFYNRPAPDGSRPGIYYVNLSDMTQVLKPQIEGISYHEGAPGHHFQIAYAQEIQRLIGRSLRSSIDLSLLGERQIVIDCDVLEADGGTRTASVTGGFVALALALGAGGWALGAGSGGFPNNWSAASPPENGS